MKHIASLVTNDLNYDQRMIRICTSLVENGYEVTLIGRIRDYSKPLQERPFRQKRLKCLFNSGPAFYAEYNIRLFLYLLFNKFDIINANDLDTILPAIWVAKLKNLPVVYDAHEYFTEQEEIVARPRVKAIWKRIEKYAIPRVNSRYTVSKGYAELFENEYHKPFSIVRNVTRLQPLEKISEPEFRYVLYQGAVNYGRALGESVEAMKMVDDLKFVICGQGDLFNDLKQQVAAQNMDDKVVFEGFLNPEKLRKFTLRATVGLTLFDKQGLSHWHSLSNRFFDYMHAGIPQIAMKYPEYEKFNREFEVAVLIPDIEPTTIANAINTLVADKTLYKRLKENALKAREVYNWQENEKVLIGAYASI